MYHNCDDESGDQGHKSCRSAPQHTCVQQQLPSSKLLQREGARAHERQREPRERSSRSKRTQVIKQIRVTMFPSGLLQGWTIIGSTSLPKSIFDLEFSLEFALNGMERYFIFVSKIDSNLECALNGIESYFFLQAKIDFDLEFALNGIKKCFFSNLCFFNIVVMDDEGDE